MSATATATKPMKDAAEEILQSVDGPLKSDDITRLAMDRGLIKSSGKTPAQTMAAQLAVDCKAKDSRFVRTAPGTYGLKGRDRKGKKAVEV